MFLKSTLPEKKSAPQAEIKRKTSFSFEYLNQEKSDMNALHINTLC